MKRVHPKTAMIRFTIGRVGVASYWYRLRDWTCFGWRPAYNKHHEKCLDLGPITLVWWHPDHGTPKCPGALHSSCEGPQTWRVGSLYHQDVIPWDSPDIVKEYE